MTERAPASATRTRASEREVVTTPHRSIDAHHLDRSRLEEDRVFLRELVWTLMNEILTREGRNQITDEGDTLRALGFRSLDFSELALRIEEALGHELNFDAPALRTIRTVSDVLAFFDEARGRERGRSAQ